MTPVFVATGNAGKLREILPLIKEHLSLRGPSSGRAPRDAEENAPDFLGNARIKAYALAKELRQEGLKDFWVLADDSGLAVDALEGAPGVTSARYAGDHVEPRIHIEKLLRELNAVTMDPAKRGAHYHCSLVLVRARPSTDDREFVAEGKCFGRIAFEARGASGFGYDPIFFVPKFNKSFAEVDYEIKNAISHRKQAFERLALELQKSGAL